MLLREAECNRSIENKMKSIKKTRNKESLVSFGRLEVKSYLSQNNKKRKKRE